MGSEERKEYPEKSLVRVISSKNFLRGILPLGVCPGSLDLGVTVQLCCQQAQLTYRLSDVHSSIISGQSSWDLIY